MNDENLRTLTPSEAREQGRLGGIASGQARRERKRLREALEEALAMPCDLNDGEATNVEAVAASLVREAVGGNVAAFRELRNTVDGVPAQRIETATISAQTYAEVEAILLGEADDE